MLSLFKDLEGVLIGEIDKNGGSIPTPCLHDKGLDFSDFLTSGKKNV